MYLISHDCWMPLQVQFYLFKQEGNVNPTLKPDL